MYSYYEITLQIKKQFSYNTFTAQTINIIHSSTYLQSQLNILLLLLITHVCKRDKMHSFTVFNRPICLLINRVWVSIIVVAKPIIINNYNRIGVTRW